MACDYRLRQGRHLGLKIRVGHSPDPDDAFMFYAIAKEKIPTDGQQIEHVVEDIESLNTRAFRSELEVTALSCHAFGLVSDRYQLLPYGASVGDNYGPIVVASKNRPRPDSIAKARIAVPGRYTTAYLALQLYEKNFKPIFTPFDQIFSAVQKGDADFGLLIHEGQLTYQEMGFEKIVDLGEWWFKECGLPLPLGINAIRRDLDENQKVTFTQVFLRSIEYAMKHREEALRYALQFGRGIDTKRGNRFVGMYVNDYSLDFGEKGLRALKFLFERSLDKGLLPSPVKIEVLSLPLIKSGS